MSRRDTRNCDTCSTSHACREARHGSRSSCTGKMGVRHHSNETDRVRLQTRTKHTRGGTRTQGANNMTHTARKLLRHSMHAHSEPRRCRCTSHTLIQLYATRRASTYPGRGATAGKEGRSLNSTTRAVDPLATWQPSPLHQRHVHSVTRTMVCKQGVGRAFLPPRGSAGPSRKSRIAHQRGRSGVHHLRISTEHEVRYGDIVRARRSGLAGTPQRAETWLAWAAHFGKKPGLTRASHHRSAQRPLDSLINTLFACH